MVYKLAEEDKLCGVIYPTYEGFKPIPKATCDMLESKCEQTIIVKCGESSEEDKKPESQSGSASASVSESVSESNSVSDSVSDSTSVSESTSESNSTSESTSESQASNSESKSESTSTSTSVSNSSSESTSTSESTSESTSTESTSESTSTESTSTSESPSVSDSTSTSESTSAESVSTSESTTSTSESTSDSTSNSQSDSTSKSDSTSTSESTSTSDSKSDSTSVSTSDSTSVSSSTSTSNSTSESTTSVSNSQSESTLVSTSESKSESISASGSTSVSNSTSTSTSVSNSLSTTEAPSESELASTSLSELSSEEYVAHSNEINTIQDSLKKATELLNSSIGYNFYVRRGNPYKPMYLKETLEDTMNRNISGVIGNTTAESYKEFFTINDVHIDPKYKMDSEHEPATVPLVVSITLPWGGKRTLTIPSNVSYVDTDIDNPIVEDPEVPAVSDEEIKNIVNGLDFYFGTVDSYAGIITNILSDYYTPVTDEDIKNAEKDFEAKIKKALGDKITSVKVVLTQNKHVGDSYSPYSYKNNDVFRATTTITKLDGTSITLEPAVSTGVTDSL